MDFGKIEKKWQRIWEKEGIYKSAGWRNGKPKKFYVLDMFPYPSGEGLHVGHPRGYIATDVSARYKTMKGYSALHPMGWDAFGLPAENYALKHKIHPKIAVAKNIKRFKEQLNKFGFTYDWDKEINTTDPEYYKWTQWIFLKMFENGLVYESREPIIWCPSCRTSLAFEDLENGECERCGSAVEKKPLRQWVLKMTAYAEKLLDGLESLDWPEPIKEQQKNWIGRSEGAMVKFNVILNEAKRSEESNKGSFVRQGRTQDDYNLEVFTTRLDTIFGCTYLVVAPENSLIKNYELRIKNYEEVKKYINQASKKTDLMRTDLAKEKTGIEIKGIKAINPFNNEEVPIFVADYVLGGYGTGAVMAVPAHDTRDYNFAKRYNLSVKQVIVPMEMQIQNLKFKNQNDNVKSKIDLNNSAYENDGILIDSGEFNGLTSKQAREKMTAWLIKNNFGNKKINYKMRDWVFARQRYWGEPFPLVYCEVCAEKIKSNKYKKGEFTKGELMNPGWVQIPEKDLPVKLPNVKSYEPSGTGESPLVNIKEWVNAKCPKCKGPGKRETNTMPQWAGSNWYYIAYLIKKGKKYEWDKKEIKKWLPIDLYVGGVEHATRHLLYARFWHKFLYDIKEVSTSEPFKKLMNQGLILAEDGRKMSKRWKNVVNPDDIIKVFGADAIRLYEMFMGPFGQSIAWNTDGIKGVSRFLDRVFVLSQKLTDNRPARLRQKTKSLAGGQPTTNNKEIEKLLHRTIKKIGEDIENFRFNTAISSLMILVNAMEKSSQLPVTNYQLLIKLLSPFAPFLTEEIWRKVLGKKKSIHLEKWPKYDTKLIVENKFKLIIQINGKFRDSIEAGKGISEEEIKKLALNSEKIKTLVGNGKIKRVIYVKDRLINIVL